MLTQCREEEFLVETEGRVGTGKADYRQQKAGGAGETAGEGNRFCESAASV